MARLESVRIQGFRSLADFTLSDLVNANVLIGPNGSGKSNFIRFFEMMSWMIRYRRLGEFVARQGGADDQLHGGAPTTPSMRAEIALATETGRNDYRFALARAHPDRFIFTEEAFRFSRKNWPAEAGWNLLRVDGSGEARIIETAQSPPVPGINPRTARVIVKLLGGCAVYQFHDTSDTSNFKTSWDASENEQLLSHGGNLASVLYRLEQEELSRFKLICEQIARILPVFDRFQIEERFGKVQLRWKAKGNDKTFGAHLTSDGSLRFFALVTLLNLPSEMLPDVLLLDEPELGLHPSAISLVGEMIKSRANDIQIIAATQSPLLVDVFDLEEIKVLEAQDGRTTCRKLTIDAYRHRLGENYATGELWQKNLLGGFP